MSTKVQPANETGNDRTTKPVSLNVSALPPFARSNASAVGMATLVVLSLNDALERLEDEAERDDAAERLEALYRALLPKPHGAEWGALALEVAMVAVRITAQSFSRVLRRAPTSDELTVYTRFIAEEVAEQFDAPSAPAALAAELNALRLPLDDGTSPSQGARQRALARLRGSLHDCASESTLEKAVRTVTRRALYASLVDVWSKAVAAQASAKISADPARARLNVGSPTR